MPHHVVVDGSNLATEGRERPSLRQLNDAVMAYMEENPEALITVVVDATFGHRIDPKEVAEFDEAINNNELVAPPAGAIGRGDAFVLSIANKVNAVILTNDSYQEFHADYPWLFDEGRLVGGKPVPHIGWVFVKRLPVRGPISRKVTAQAKKKPGRGAVGSSSAAQTTVSANQPMPVPTAPPPGPAVASKRAAKPAAKPAAPTSAAEAPVTPTTAPVAAPAPSSQKDLTVNDLVSFITFVEHHAVGSRVSAVVHHYSSHGAYVQIGDVMGYVPLRLMADPAPRSAREFMKVGESVELVVEGYFAEKRSIDLATPAMSTVPPAEEKQGPVRRSTKKAPVPVKSDAPTPVDAPTPKVTRKKAAVVVAPESASGVTAASKPAAAPRKSAPRKAAVAPVAAPDEPVPAKKVATATAVARKAPEKKAPEKKAPVKKAPVKRAAVSTDPVASPAPKPRKSAATATPVLDTPPAAPKRRGRSAS